jgi:SNF2 family DNA or RNA helicase
MITLDHHQQRAVDQALASYRQGRRHAFIAHDVGIGKTFTSATIALRVAETQRAKYGDCTTWFVTLAGDVKRQQREQLNKLLGSDKYFDVLVIEGNAETRANWLAAVAHIRPPFVVMNYDQLFTHWEQLKQTVKPWDGLILDESDLIQNEGSNRSRMVQGMALLVYHRILNTATPIWNRADGLYPQLKICDPVGTEKVVVKEGAETREVIVPTASEEWGEFADFARRYLVVENGRVVGTKNQRELHERLVAFGMDIVASEDVLDLDIADPVEYKMPLTPSGQEIYNIVRAGIDAWIDEHEPAFARGGVGEKSNLKQQLLRQIPYARRAVALSPRNMLRLIKAKRARSMQHDESFANYINQQQMAELERMSDGDLHGNTKAEWLVAYLKEHWADPRKPGGPVVYSEYTDVLDEVEAYLRRANITRAWGRIDGSQTKKRREETRLGVQGGYLGMCLISDGGGRGLNLQKLSELIVLTPTWCPTQITQAFGRVKRRGQDNPIQLVWSVAIPTIESKKMVNRLKKKERDTNSILRGERGRRFDPMLNIGSLEEVREWL